MLQNQFFYFHQQKYALRLYPEIEWHIYLKNLHPSYNESIKSYLM